MKKNRELIVASRNLFLDAYYALNLNIKVYRDVSTNLDEKKSLLSVVSNFFIELKRRSKKLL